MKTNKTLALLLVFAALCTARYSVADVSKKPAGTEQINNFTGGFTGGFGINNFTGETIKVSYLAHWVGGQELKNESINHLEKLTDGGVLAGFKDFTFTPNNIRIIREGNTLYLVSSCSNQGGTHPGYGSGSRQYN